MKLNETDWKLSMLISRRRRDGEEKHDTRSLLVHRLRSGAKAVLRLSLAKDVAKWPREYGIFCEPCGGWAQCDGDGSVIECDCGRVYVLEFAVYAEVPAPGPKA